MAGFMGVWTIFASHFFACVFLPWTARESLRPVVPLIGLNALITGGYAAAAVLTGPFSWGVIGAVTPSTHSVPTLTGNAINMIAAGNAAVFNTHPAACNVAALAVRAYNEAIFQEIGVSDLLTTVVKPTLESFDAMCKHPKVKLLCVTGGPAVVAAAMKTGKRAVCAGPGNPILDNLWRERLYLCDRMIAVRPHAPFSIACRLEALRGAAIGVAKSLRKQLGPR